MFPEMQLVAMDMWGKCVLGVGMAGVSDLGISRVIYWQLCAK